MVGSHAHPGLEDSSHGHRDHGLEKEEGGTDMGTGRREGERRQDRRGRRVIVCRLVGYKGRGWYEEMKEGRMFCFKKVAV